MSGELRRADREARELAVSEFERALVLEAGAGTGKTRALVARLATWLLGPGWREAEVELETARASGRAVADGPGATAALAADRAVAITFTDAAAAEMASRLGRLLAELAGGGPACDLDPPPPLLDGVDLPGRAGALASALGRLRIQTIHAFCHRLLSEHPFEAGLHPSPTIDPGGDALLRAATEALRGRLLLRSDPIVALIAAGVDPLELLETLIGLVAAGATPADLERLRFDDAAAAAIVARLAAALEPALARMRPLAAAVGRRVRTLPPAVEELEALAAELEPAEPCDLARLERLAELARESAATLLRVLARWRSEGPGKLESEALGAGAAPFAADAARLAERLDELAALRPALFESARECLRPLLEETRARLRRDGVLTFDDLLARSVELLGRRRDVRDRVRRGIRQLLVDEFQDTDARQCRLIELLVLEPGPPAPGLFLVGDPKQSIYAFRSADLESYEALLSRLDAAGGRRAPLAVNFRSVPALLEEVERAIAPVLRAEPGVQPPFVPLLPSRAEDREAGFRRSGRRAVESWVSWSRREGERGLTAARAAELEADAIAADLRDLHDREGLPWRSFALLLRARGDLESYLDALRRAAIPFEVQKDRSYFQRREVIDLACAVRAVLDPADLLGLVAFLRSPLVGVPDAAWLPLWSRGFAARLAELGGPDPERLAELDRIVEAAAAQTPPSASGAAELASWPVALSDAVRSIADLRATFPRLSVPDWIERLRLRLLPEPIAAARHLGRFGLANVERLLDGIEAALADAVEPSRALSELRSVLAERREAEEARPPGGDVDAVAVLTIHTAKGLEFDHVYLPQLHKQPRRETGIPAHDVLPPPVAAPAAPRELVLLGAPSPGWWSGSERRRRAREAEGVRLLYVALTRARERLVLCASWPPHAGARAPAGSFVELLAHRRPQQLDPEALAAGFEDRNGVLWRLAEPRPRTGARARPTAVTEVVAGATEAPGRVRERRESARSRQRRPQVAAVTDAHADPPAGGAAASGDGDSGREAALALGAALHVALERLAPGTLESAGAPADGPVADALARFAAGALGARFRALEGRILARELPLLLSVGAGEGGGPLAALSGALDLLYRDPEGGGLVVADFKSDAVSGEAALAERCARYAPQLRTYGEAVRGALGLDAPPRLELWFLALDRVVEIPPAGGDPPGSG